MDLKDKLEEILGRMTRDTEASHTPELCRQVPCLGTPDDMARLIRTGYGDMLCRSLVVGIERGTKTSAQHHLPIVQLRHNDGGCVMFQRGECLLRHAGLTPIQGRIHNAAGEILDRDMKHLVILRIVSAWADPQNMETALFCLESLREDRKKPMQNHTS